MTVLYILAKCIAVLLSAVSFAMFLRAILSFFMPDPQSSRTMYFLCLITEPFIIPVRVLMQRLNIGQNSPIDWSFFVTYLILAVLEWFLPII